MRVDDFMTTPIITCQSNTSLEEAARKLWEHDCGALAIVNDDGKLVGMLTDRDICMCAMLQAKPLGDIGIPLAMSKAVYAVTRDASIREVESVMAAQQIRRVPVVDADHRPIGIVSINDLVRDVTRAVPRIGERRVGMTLAAIGAHRSRVEAA